MQYLHKPICIFYISHIIKLTITSPSNNSTLLIDKTLLKSKAISNKQNHYHLVKIYSTNKCFKMNRAQNFPLFQDAQSFFLVFLL